MQTIAYKVTVFETKELGKAFIFLHHIIICHYTLAIYRRLDVVNINALSQIRRICPDASQRTSAEQRAAAVANFSIGRVLVGISRAEGFKQELYRK